MTTCMSYIKYNTIDIDLDAKNPFHGKEYLNRIIRLITNCESCLGVQIKDSDSKGYHIFLFCKTDCDLCRLIFDDSKRYMMDYDRIEERKNVMFDAKHIKLNET